MERFSLIFINRQIFCEIPTQILNRAKEINSYTDIDLWRYDKKLLMHVPLIVPTPLGILPSIKLEQSDFDDFQGINDIKLRYSDNRYRIYICGIVNGIFQYGNYLLTSETHELSELDQLKNKIEELEKRVQELKLHCQYMPDGPGYEEARSEFKNLQNIDC